MNIICLGLILDSMNKNERIARLDDLASTASDLIKEYQEYVDILTAELRVREEMCKNTNKKLDVANTLLDAYREMPEVQESIQEWDGGEK